MTYEQQIGKAPAPPAPAKISYQLNTCPMTGTTGSSFKLVGAFKSGRIGYRELGGGTYRVRVEPASGVTLALPNGSTGWTQPGFTNNRYSIVVNGIPNLKAALAHASQLLAEVSVAL